MPQLDELLCEVHSLKYDFDTRTGELFMGSGSCCDFNGCTQLFEKIDEKVKHIMTFSGDKPDTHYIRVDGMWRDIPS